MRVLARTHAIAERVFTPGEYGPFVLDGFDERNADYIEVVLSQINWPTQGEILRLTLAWGDSASASFLLSGVSIDPRTNLPRATVQCKFDIPRSRSGNERVKRPVTGASVSIEVFQAVTTAVSMSVV